MKANLDHAIGQRCCFHLSVDEDGIRLGADGQHELEAELAKITGGQELLSAILTLQDFAAFLERDDGAEQAITTIQRIARAATARAEMLLGRHRAKNDRAPHRMVGALPLRARHVGAKAPPGSMRVAAFAVPMGKLR